MQQFLFAHAPMMLHPKKHFRNSLVLSLCLYAIFIEKTFFMTNDRNSSPLPQSGAWNNTDIVKRHIDGRP